MKKLAVIVSFLAIVIVLTLSILGVPELSYAPPTSDRYLWGAAHVHSDFSDGRASRDAIAQAAASARVSFVMLGDHGPPHRDAALVDDTIEGVRFVGGSQVELPEGELVVSDVRTLSRFKLSPYPPDAIAQAHRWGGIAVIGDPYDPARAWTYWESDFLPDGIEIVNVTSQFRALPVLEKMRWAWLSSFNRYDTVKRLTPPTAALERWDELLARGPVWGFLATGAHGGFPVSERSTDSAIPFPSYETVFSLVGLGVDRRYRDDPMSAIRRGDFFSVIRGAGEPESFTFRAGDRPAGSFVPAGTALHVELDAPGLNPRVVLKRNGKTLTETMDNVIELDASPGMYRVEVYLEDHPLLASDVPWLLSNPIFVGVSRPSHSGDTGDDGPTCPSVETFPLEELRVEKDDRSAGSIEITEEGAAKLWYRLSSATPDEPDRWVAFALRKPFDLSAREGIVLDADAARPMRFWVEVRSENRSHYASFGLEKGANRVVIPWDRFYAISGGRERPNLGGIDAIFLTVNTSNSYTGFRRALTLKAFGACG